MRIRCQHLGLIAGLALALSVSAASDWSASDATPASAQPDSAHAAFTHSSADTSSLPVPAPVLFLAGGLLAMVAMVRWRQRTRTHRPANRVDLAAEILRAPE